VRNGGAVNELDPATGNIRAVPIGDAHPNQAGDFMFEPGRGGGRLDKVALPEPDFRERYVQASHFGEVNTYFHLDLMASYIQDLLRELSAPPLPRVIAVVNAHHAATECNDVRDGIRRGDGWLPFQGGHYRLPSRHYEVWEHEPISPEGEIHLGPGRQLLQHGALVQARGDRYRANASHNAGILYHEYGHHVTRHTADFRANSLRRPDRQNNRKTALDEGICDYWAATMLDTPHIWAWHHQHDSQEIHPRSLVSPKTMADYDFNQGADPHANGTILAAALWDLRTQMAIAEPQGVRLTNRMLLQALILLGRLVGDAPTQTVAGVRNAREGFATALSALLQANEQLYAGRFASKILETFARRCIYPNAPALERDKTATVNQEEDVLRDVFRSSSLQSGTVAKHVSPDEIPASEDLFSAQSLETHLKAAREPSFSLIAVGDIMLGARAKQVIAVSGPDYPFEAVRPLLLRSPIVMGNLEGPFARKAQKVQRTHSYRVNPKLAASLLRAGINVVTLANNHLLDCGREGVLETLDALDAAGVAAIGAGVHEGAAHMPCILQSDTCRVGLLGYYWNRRTAATAKLPGSAMDTLDALEADIGALRRQTDRVVVTFHWGVPYEREPSPEDRVKARFAVDCGADAVIGHHPHIVQPFEVYRGCPIFYSVGNFAFGSGNSCAESLLVGLRFEERWTTVRVYPVYVKNRDPRVAYQPKVLCGRSADRILQRIADSSGENNRFLKVEMGSGTMCLPRPGSFSEITEKTHV
jgi:hypothetical protein